MTDLFDTVYRRSLEDPRGFWAEAAADIVWTKPWDAVLDEEASPAPRWFVGGELNTCYNALDRHADGGRADQAALIYDSPVTGVTKSFTYSELRDLVARFAGVLARRGVEKGDRVIVYMPMIPEAVVAMLACARLGAVHSVVFGGFASNELAARIDDSEPKVVVSASCGIETARVIEYKSLLDKAIELARHKPTHCIIFQREMVKADLQPGRDLDWEEEMASTTPHPCVPVAATDPLYILYTSGTTGQPKGIVRDNGGHAVALKWTMKHIYNIEPGQVYWAASDVGWVVGHSYIVYGPLLYGCTTVLYEGKPVGTPDAGAFWRVIADHGVSCMFTAPTAIRAIRQQDPEGALIAGYDLSQFDSLFLAGERCDPDTLGWAQHMLGVPVIDHWWQTETGWAIVSNCLGIEPLTVVPGSPTRPVPGWDLRVMGPDGEDLPTGETGALCVKLPMPPGAFPTLWNAEQRFTDTYFSTYPGFYETADAGFIDEDGYVHVMARTDDVINVAGHRLSTGALEEVLTSHPDVAECAVLGVADVLKGQIPVGFLVLKAGAERDKKAVASDVIAMVRERIGPVAAFKLAVVVARLPKTRSGKILRATIAKIADGKSWTMPATVDDPEIFAEIGAALETLGYPR
ncbi:MAG: propionyl-CoA synthetase [Actinomycetota bacterium]|nr:propionyl-CoA synthetase [Actinomycetota bacterium]MDK1039546.1 propionyl-CoA synthetase [Actinomycetota bacterium]